MSRGNYYLIQHPSKKQDSIHGQKQEHIHFKIHLDNEKIITSYVLPSKRFDPLRKTYLIYMGEFEAESALSSGQIIEKGKLWKLDDNRYKMDNKFIIHIYQPPKLKREKSKIFFVSYGKIK